MSKRFATLVALVFVAIVGPASAQTKPPQESKNWSAGMDLSAGDWATSSDDRPAPGVPGGFSPASERKPSWTIWVGKKPIGRVGAELRYTQFSGSFGASESVNGGVLLWGSDITSGIYSTANVLVGPKHYVAAGSDKSAIADFLVNRTVGFDDGSISLFGGLKVVHAEATNARSLTQQFIFTSKLANGNLDPRGILETYTFASSSQTKWTGYGPVVGVEGEVCLLGSLILEGRGAVGYLPLGRAKSVAEFAGTKEGVLIEVAGGFNANPIQQLFWYDLAPDPERAMYMTSQKSKTTTLEGRGVIKWRFRGQSASVDIGVGLSALRLNGLPDAARYSVPQGRAPGQGAWARATRRSIVKSPVLTVSIWF